MHKKKTGKNAIRAFQAVTSNLRGISGHGRGRGDCEVGYHMPQRDFCIEDVVSAANISMLNDFQ